MKATEIRSFIHEATSFSNDRCTRIQFLNQLSAFEKRAAIAILNDDKARMDEVTAFIQASARKKELITDPRIITAISYLRNVSKYLSIIHSGINSEKLVNNALKNTEREYIHNYKNVPVYDNSTETEIDNIVLTEDGIFLLEVKSAKSDVTINEQGRIIFAGEDRIVNEDINEKIETKRSLLIKMVTTELEKCGMPIPLNITTYLVFSAAPGFQYKISDRQHKQPCCRNSKIKYVIRDHSIDRKYTAEELECLESIFKNLQDTERYYKASLDFPAIIDAFAIAAEALFPDTPIPTKTTSNADTTEAPHEPNHQTASKSHHANTKLRKICSGLTAAGLALILLPDLIQARH